MSGLDNLPPVRDSLSDHGLLAKKSFGQHFLLDLNVTRKIARLAGPLDGETVIEVGPGPGGLTRAMLTAGARVIAVEKDPRFLPLLQELAQASAGALILVEGDALKIDEATLLDGAGGHVVSNLPYNVGTPLLIKWLTAAWRPVSLTLMFQKEVADRIAAQPGAAAYGRLSVIAQAICEARVVMDLPPRAFTPSPKVSSAVVRLDPRADAPPRALISALERVTAAAFGQRRKMLRASLKGLGGDALCARACIASEVRAEAVDVAGFLRLAAAL